MFDAGWTEGDRDVAAFTVVVDAFDQQLDHSGLFAWGQAVPQGVEVGQRRGNFGFVDNTVRQRGQLIFDLA